MITFRAAPLDSVKHEEIYTLFNNIELILQNSAEILQNEEYKNIRVKGTGIDGIYIGHIDLLLGNLLILWNNDSPWRNGQKFYYHLGGSPLSGMSFCAYWQDGELGSDKNLPSFCTLLRPANMVIKNLKEKPAGVTLPFPRRKRSDLSINDLLKQLKQ
jgi:hypothetical protein